MALDISTFLRTKINVIFSTFLYVIIELLNYDTEFSINEFDIFFLFFTASLKKCVIGGKRILI